MKSKKKHKVRKKTDYQHRHGNVSVADLMESQERFRRLSEATNEGIVIHEHGRVIDANQRFASMFGYTMRDIIRKDGLKLIHPGHRKQVRKNILSGENRPYETVGVRKGGDPFPLEICAKAAKYRGKDVRIAILRDITARKRAEKRLAKINECFLTFGTDTMENINNLVKICGELMCASCALYNRLERDLLCSVGMWKAPKCYNPIGKAEGRICCDVIKNADKNVLVVRDLQHSKYKKTDPNVKLYNLMTYIGAPVRFGKTCIGSLCVVYGKDFIPEEDDKKVMEILASAIAVEEERLGAESALKKSHERYYSLFENSPISLWEEDFSGVKMRLDNFKAEGVTDFRTYFREHPEIVAECVSMVRIYDVNRATLELFRARTKKDFWRGLGSVFTEDSYETALDELIAIANGKTTFSSETKNQTLGGKTKDVYLKWTVVPGYEDSYGKVLVSLMDITDRKRFENELKDSEEKFKSLAENSPNMIFIVYRGRIVYVNRKCTEAMGYKRKEFYKDKFQFDTLVPKGSRKRVNDILDRYVMADKVSPFEQVLVKKNGEQIDAIISTKLINFNGKRSILGIVTDITAYNMSQQELRRQRDMAKNYLDIVGSMIVALDTKGRVTMINKRVSEILGYEQDEVVGKPWFFSFMPKGASKNARARFREIIKGKIKKNEYSEWPVLSASGAEKIISWHNTVLKDEKGNIVGTLSAGSDVTERRMAEIEKEVLNKELTRSNNRLRQLVLRDPHTGLYNHHYLEDAIESEFERAKNEAQPLSVLGVDIDYFKSINDLYGYNFGDAVLKQFAKKIKKLVRNYDTVIRLGGEDFIIISPGTDRQTATSLAERVLETINLYEFGDKKHRVKLTLSIAVASYPEDKVYKGLGLINITEKILSKAKDDGGNRVFSSVDMGKAVKNRFLAGAAPSRSQIKFLKNKLDKLNKQSKQTIVESIFAFAKTIELKDKYTGEHVERTVHYATELAKELRLTKDEIELIKEASVLHDLGKVGISEKILLKKSKLSEREFEEIKKHPQIAADILRPIQYLQGIIPLIFYHHERWDGMGYPSGLKGDEIPLGARIIALADGYQALSSDRPYRPAYNIKDVVKILRSESGTKYDPKVIKAFFNILRREKRV